MLTLFQGEFGTRDTFRFIEESVGLGLWTWDLKTNAMEWSRGLFALFGLQPDAVVPHFDLFAGMIHPDDRLPPSEVRRTIADMPMHRDFRIIRQNGRVRWLHNKGEVLIGPDGSATRAIGVIRDTTTKGGNLHKLQVSEERLQALTSTVGATVWIVDKDGNSTVVKNWKELRADQGKIAHNGTLIELVHPDDCALTLKAWQDARSRCDLYEVEHRLLQPDGGYRWHLSRAVPIKSSNDQVEEYIGVTLDIHATKVLPPMKDAERRLTGAQIRAARGILCWSVRDLADHTNVSAATIRRLEESDGATEDDMIPLVSRALTKAGVEFFSPVIGKPGVSLR